MEFGALIADSVSDGRISADEILELRRLGWADGKIGPDEAEELFAANDACALPTTEWCDFFVEALCHFIVETVPPAGYIDDEMADELITRIDRDGRLGSMAELELLVRVLEVARNAPERLKAYALKQVEEAVQHGDGPTRHGELTPKGINEAECALLRRLIFAPAGDRPAAVSHRKLKCCSGSRTRHFTRSTPPRGKRCSCKASPIFCSGSAAMNRSAPRARASLKPLWARTAMGSAVSWAGC